MCSMQHLHEANVTREVAIRTAVGLDLISIYMVELLTADLGEKWPHGRYSKQMWEFHTTSSLRCRICHSSLPSFSSPFGESRCALPHCLTWIHVSAFLSSHVDSFLDCCGPSWSDSFLTIVHFGNLQVLGTNRPVKRTQPFVPVQRIWSGNIP